MSHFENLANLLFPEPLKTPQAYEEIYPQRHLSEGARVTRFAPSPTGFLHIGGLFAALVAKRTAMHTKDGVFFLRIEDTDKKREIEGGVDIILSGMKDFGVVPDEGVFAQGDQRGDYGPYMQSERNAIYHTFAKMLVEQGMAYPCFCSAEDLDEMRKKQEDRGLPPGYYGSWAKCRNLSFEEQKSRIENGEEYILRFRSPGDAMKKVVFKDVIKGKIEMPQNIQDIVLLKSDWTPTYHFAHAVDDHLMRTTHVVRGDEWISSVPIHIQLFVACGFKVPNYAHIAPIMKEDNGSRRKLSKRKDPEAAVEYYTQLGYPAESVQEYLLTLANSNFEEWRTGHADVSLDDFLFSLKNMSVSGALFDLMKLEDISKTVISRMDAKRVTNEVTAWAKAYDDALYQILTKDLAYTEAVFSIERGGKKPRKDLAKWSETREYLAYFYDALYTPEYALPENVTAEDAVEILIKYKEIYDTNDNHSEWFAKIRDLGESYGYTPKVKEYRKNPENFKGHVGDVAGLIRIAVTSRTNTPDLYAILATLKQQEVEKRLDDAIAAFGKEA